MVASSGMAIGEFLPRVTDAGHRGPECLVQGNREKRGCGVGAVVHILIEQALRLALAPNQTNGVDIEDESCFATPIAGVGVEHPRFAEGLFDLVQAPGMLVQQISQIGRRLICGGNGQEHAVR